MFRTFPLFIIRSFSQYIQQWYMSYSFANSLRAESGRYNKTRLRALSWLIAKIILTCTVSKTKEKTLGDAVFDSRSKYSISVRCQQWVKPRRHPPTCHVNVSDFEEWKTNLMSLAILFHLLCVQHVSDINMSIFGSLRLCWWITKSVVLFSVRCVLEFLLRLIFGGVSFCRLKH